MNSYLNDELMDFLIEEEDLENVAGGSRTSWYCPNCETFNLDPLTGVCWNCNPELSGWEYGR